MDDDHLGVLGAVVAEVVVHFQPRGGAGGYGKSLFRSGSRSAPAIQRSAESASTPYRSTPSRMSSKYSC